MSIIAGSKYGGHNNGSEPAMTRVSETGWLTTGVRGWEMRPLALRPSCSHTGSSLCAKCSMAWRNNTHHVRATHNARNNFLSSFRAIAFFVYFYYSFPFLSFSSSSSVDILSLSLSICLFFSYTSLLFRCASRLDLPELRLVLLCYRRSCTTVPINDLPDVPPIEYRIGHGFAAPMVRC